MDKDKFLQLVELTPLVSIDLIIENGRDEILLGKRTNKPAQGYWFVPGGRIRKEESLREAFTRISLVELGVELDFAAATLLGAYDHIYHDNFFAEPGVSTHYVALGYKVNTPAGLSIETDSQHSEVEWWPISKLLNHEQVHVNTKNYFKDL